MQCRDGGKKSVIVRDDRYERQIPKNDNAAAVVDKLSLLFVVPGVVVVARLLML